LYQELRQYKPGAIADLHDSLRSRILSTYFRFSRLPLARIDKGRDEKKRLTRKHQKQLKPVRKTTERYADVFRKLGLDISLAEPLQRTKRSLPKSLQGLFGLGTRAKIGIAPFAKHPPKVYPLDKMEQVVNTLSERGYALYIFGGGADEQLV